MSVIQCMSTIEGQYWSDIQCLFLLPPTVGFEVFFHFSFSSGLVAGDVVRSQLSVADDDIFDNGATISVILQVPSDVIGVAVSDPAFISLTVLDNDGE